MQAVWSGEDTAHEGHHFSARGVRHLPVPIARPRPPIWIGGNSIRAIRRAVSHFEGWSPFGTAGYGKASRTADISGVDDLVSRIESARQMAADVGRLAPLEICYSAGGLADPSTSVEERRDLLGRFAEAGVTWLPVSVPGADRSEVAAGIDAFAESFIV